MSWPSTWTTVTPLGSLVWLKPIVSPSAGALSDCSATIAATSTISSAVAPRDRSAMGRARPWRIGPIAAAPASRCTSLYPMLPASRSGKTSTLARPADAAIPAPSARRPRRRARRPPGARRRRRCRAPAAESAPPPPAPAPPAASGAALGAVGEEGHPGRVAHQPGAVARRRQRDFGQLARRGLRHHGAVGEGEHRVVGQHHVERGAHQADARRGADRPERGAYHVARGTDRAGDAAVGLTQGHQCGAEVERVGGEVERVHPVPHPVGPALPQKLGDAAEPRIPRGIDAPARRARSARPPAPSAAARPPRGPADRHPRTARSAPGPLAARSSSRSRKLMSGTAGPARRPPPGAPSAARRRRIARPRAPGSS